MHVTYPGHLCRRSFGFVLLYFVVVLKGHTATALLGAEYRMVD